MKAFTSKILSIVLAFSVIGAETACTNNTTLNVVNTIAAQLPVYLSTAAAIANLSGNTELDVTLQAISGIAQVDYTIIQPAVRAYQDNQTSGNFNALVAAVNEAASKINVQVLQANRVSDPRSDAVALASIGLFAAVLNGMAFALAGVNKTTTPALVAASIRYDDVKPFLAQKDIELVAQTYGVPIAYVNGL